MAAGMAASEGAQVAAVFAVAESPAVVSAAVASADLTEAFVAGSADSAAATDSGSADTGPATMAMAGVGPATMATIIRITAVIRTRTGIRMTVATAMAATDTVAMDTERPVITATVRALASDSVAVASRAEDGGTFPVGTDHPILVINTA